MMGIMYCTIAGMVQQKIEAVDQREIWRYEVGGALGSVRV
jgi:hypothetical protein